MSQITRDIEPVLLNLHKQYPLLAITGPWASGKTTTARTLFTHLPYASFKNFEIREQLTRDPLWFFNNYPQGAIFDDIHLAPELIGHLTQFIHGNGPFILISALYEPFLSKDFKNLAQMSIICPLLPLAYHEIPPEAIHPSIDDILLKGSFPALFDLEKTTVDFYTDYLNTTVDNNALLMKHVSQTEKFYRFLKMCAQKNGEIINLSMLGEACGVSHNTARAWLLQLEAHAFIFLLNHHPQHFKKRVVKMPKLYFYDTGLLCHLLNIPDNTVLSQHPARGKLFETFIIGELMKFYFSKGQMPNIFFFKEHLGQELPCVIDTANGLIPVSINASDKITEDNFMVLRRYTKFTGARNGFLACADLNPPTHDHHPAIPYTNIFPHLAQIL